MEILLAVLEAKLNSIPGVDDETTAAAPAAAPSVESTSASQSSAAEAGQAYAPAVAPAAAAEAAVPAPANTVKVKDHPAYAPFIKMLRIGVPPPVVSGKAAAAGLDVSLLDNPDADIPLNGADNID